MVIDKTKTHYNALTLNGQQLEVTDFKYLGSVVNTESNVMQEIIEALTSQEHQCKKIGQDLEE